MTSIDALTQQQFLFVREAVAIAGLTGGRSHQIGPHDVTADERQSAENLMKAGVVDVKRVLDEGTRENEMPLRYSVIKHEPTEGLFDVYFVVASNSLSVEVVPIMSDYDRGDLDFGKHILLGKTVLKGRWTYIYPEDAR